MKPGGAQRNIPGAPAAGRVNCNREIIVSCDVAFQKFFSRTFQTEAAMRPPGFRTRIISFNASWISGKNINPNRQLIASNESFSKGKAETSQHTVSKFLIP